MAEAEERRMDTKRGQALMELVVGLFALALVVSALCGFAICIVKSLKMQNSLRVGATSQQDEVQVGEFAAKYVFGTKIIKLNEKVEMPQTTILR